MQLIRRWFSRGYREELYEARAFGITPGVTNFVGAWRGLNSQLQGDRVLQRHKQRRFHQDPFQLRNEMIYKGRKKQFNRLVTNTIDEVLRLHRESAPPVADDTSK
jgi:hypothetical protein